MPLSRKLAKLILMKQASLASVIELLTKYKMLSLLPSVHQALLQMSLQVGKKDILMIETPFPLNVDSIKIIKRMVGNENAEHEISINKNILAGFKARFKGVLYDGSAERIIKQINNS